MVAPAQAERPVAWRYRVMYPGESTWSGWSVQTIEPHPAVSSDASFQVQPLFLRPSAWVDAGERQEVAELIPDSFGGDMWKWNHELAGSLPVGTKLYTSPPPDGRGWQPIESAPKDGTHILASLPDSDVCYVIEWADVSKGIRVEAGDGVGWHMAWDGYFFGPHEQPICWMPPPPSAGRGQG